MFFPKNSEDEMYISTAALCRILSWSNGAFYNIRKHLGAELVPVELERVGRGRARYRWHVPSVVMWLDRIMPAPLDRDTLRRMFEAATP